VPPRLEATPPLHLDSPATATAAAAASTAFATSEVNGAPANPIIRPAIYASIITAMEGKILCQLLVRIDADDARAVVAGIWA